MNKIFHPKNEILSRCVIFDTSGKGVITVTKYMLSITLMKFFSLITKMTITLVGDVRMNRKLNQQRLARL